MNNNDKKPKDDEDLPGYPSQPSSEDIFNTYEREEAADPEEPFVVSESTLRGVDEYTDDLVLGSDLDVPGSELDDDMESIGSEDEENNYYSLGGDDNSALEED